MLFLNKISHFLKYGLLLLIIYPLFIWNFSHAAQDIAWDIFEKAILKETITRKWETVEQAGKFVFEWYTQVGINSDWIWVSKEQSLAVKVTKFLLSLVIALSITMIIYNSIVYIVQTWNGKDSADLVKNILYIVIGIIIALFSSLIITLIQSIPKTLSEIDGSVWTKKQVEEIIQTNGTQDLKEYIQETNSEVKSELKNDWEGFKNDWENLFD